MIEFEGAAYDLMSRGNHGQTVFRNRRDREVFLETLDEACERLQMGAPSAISNAVAGFREAGSVEVRRPRRRVATV